MFPLCLILSNSSTPMCTETCVGTHGRGNPPKCPQRSKGTGRTSSLHRPCLMTGHSARVPSRCPAVSVLRPATLSTISPRRGPGAWQEGNQEQGPGLNDPLCPCVREGRPGTMGCRTSLSGLRKWCNYGQLFLPHGQSARVYQAPTEQGFPAGLGRHPVRSRLMRR